MVDSIRLVFEKNREKPAIVSVHQSLALFCWFALVCLLLLPSPVSGQDAPEEDLETSDLAAERTLEEKVAAIEGLSEVTVSVEGGVATLSGRVGENGSRVLAAELAKSQEGVVEVRNEVLIGGDISHRLGDAFERSLFKLRLALGYLPLLLVAVVLVILSFYFAAWISRRPLVLRLAGSNRFLQEVVRQCVKVAVCLAGLLIALDLLDATALVGAVFGAAGVAGLAVGFAFRDLIENYVASLLLSLRRPFRPNDYVKIESHEGRIVSLNTRATTLITLDGNHLRLPNALVFKSVILNYSRNAERRFDFVVGVGVTEDLLEAQEIGVETLKSLKGVLDDPPPWAAITELADSSVTIKFHAWVNQTQYNFAKVKGHAIRSVKLALEEAGMDLPEPIHRVRLENAASSSIDPKQPAESQSVKRTPGRQSENDEDLRADDRLEKQVEEESKRAGKGNLLLDETPME